MRLILALIFLLFVYIANSGTYYISYSDGSDANNGIAKATPWKRAPGMVGFSGAYSHTVGDRFIFKGGVTWPTGCFQWKLTQGGNVSTRDYYGADTTWYSGASFTRPLFDFEHRSINGWTLGAGFLLEGANYVTVDNLEFAHHRTPLAQGGIGTWGTCTITFYNADQNVITNCVIRDWSHPTPIPGGTSGGGGVIRVGSGNNRVSHCTFHQDNVAAKNGAAMWNLFEIDYCEVRNTCTAVMYSYHIHHNHIYNLTQPGDPWAHANAILSPGGTLIHHNWIHDISFSETIFIGGGYYGPHAAWVYNNVVYNVSQSCVALDSDGQNDPGQHNYILNNSFEAPSNGAGLCVYSSLRNNGPIGHLEMRNNHFIANDNPIVIMPVVTTFIHGNNLTNTYSAAQGLGYTESNQMQPTDATKPTVGAGVDLSAYFTTDYDGTARSVPWDIGAHEWGGAPPTPDPVPGTLVISTASQSVSEAAGSVTVTVHRTGGSDGAVGCSYATANGTATAGVNYTAASGSLSWGNGDNANKTFTITVLDADALGNLDFTATISAATGGATIGTPATQTITLQGTGTPPPPGPGYLIGWTWPATNGVISPPFVVESDYVYQTIQTGDPALGGSANYTFTNSAGFYRVECEVDCADGANDSWFVAMNSEPISPTNVWDVLPTPTDGWETRTVGWRGTGAYNDPEFPVQVWHLETGTNTLVIRGRETGKIRTVTIVPVFVPPEPDPEEPEPEPPAPVTILSATSASANGYYNAGDAITISLTFSTNVTVEGSPSIALNSGGIAAYQSGSGGTNIVFSYTVLNGHTSTALDYVATNSLALNGGSIRHSTVDADLTLPTPGEAGSLSHQKTVIIDTTNPTATISAPSLSTTEAGSAEVHYTVTYADSNFSATTLTASDVTLIKTGTADAVVSVSNAAGSSETVTLSNISGSGTLRIAVSAGTAYDLAGNPAPAAGPSSVVTVTTATVRRVMRITTLRGNQITVLQ